MSSARTTSVPESVTARRNLLRMASGSSSTYTVPCSVPPVVDILRVGVLEVAHPRADGRDAVLGHHERLAEALVEAPRDVAHELEVLALVLAHRHLVGAVGQHVGRLQHG